LGKFESEYAADPEITDMLFLGEYLYVIGMNNTIMSIGINDSNLKIISMLSTSVSSHPLEIYDTQSDTMLYIKCAYNLCFSKNGLLFEPITKYYQNPQYSKVYKINFSYFDENLKKLYLGGLNSKGDVEGVFSTTDYGKSFEFKEVPLYYFNLSDPVPPFRKLSKYPLPVQKRENGFVTSCYTIYSKTIFTKILTFDTDFNTITRYLDTTYAIDFVDSKDTNSFLVHCLNVKDNTYEIKYTTNKGQNWEMIKKYNEPDSMFFFNDLQINGKRVLVMFLYNPKDSMYTVEALDVEKRAVNEIYKYKIKPGIFTDMMNGVCVEQDTVYLAIDDTIFYTSDIYNRSKWQYYLLPDNGRIIRKFQKIGNRFWAAYMDDNYYKIYRSYNAFWLKIVNDSTVNVVESETKSDETYLYVYPPKPTPATNNVRTLIYFDPKVEFVLDKVGVTDVTGTRIEGGGNISFERLSPYSGYLNWNCSQAANGVYFIHISHGNNARVAKVIISR